MFTQYSSATPPEYNREGSITFELLILFSVFYSFWKTRYCPLLIFYLYEDKKKLTFIFSFTPSFKFEN